MTDHQSSDLERIERYARHALNSAISITGAVRVLRSQPKFETNAEATLRAAEAELEVTLDAVRKAMQEFSTKSVTA
jgi:hypothetical protein